MLNDNAVAADTNDAPNNSSVDDSDVASPWSSISRQVSGNVPGIQTQQPDASTVAGTDTRLNGLLETGLYTGAASGGIWHAADDAYVHLPGAVQNSNKYVQFFGDHLSPISRDLDALSNAQDRAGFYMEEATIREAMAASAVAGDQTAITAMIAGTRSIASRGDVIADLQQQFVDNADFSQSALKSHSILESFEVAPAKAYLSAVNDSLAAQADLDAAEHALTTAETTVGAVRRVLPSSLTTDADKSAWLNGRTVEEITDHALSQARGSGRRPLFNAVETHLIKELRDASIQQAVAEHLRDTAAATAAATATARDAATSTFETLMAGHPNAAEKISFVKTPGLFAEAIDRAATFTAAEAATLTRYGQLVANKTAASAAATAMSSETNAANAALENVRNGLLNGARAKGYAMAIGQGAGIGLATAGVNIAADYVLSKALGEEPKLTGTSAWGIEVLALPLIMFNPKMGIAGKIGLSGAAYAGSHIFGSLSGEPSGRFTALGRPGWTEIGLSTVGAMLPLKDWRVRALAATVGWGLGKAYAIATDDGHEAKGN